MNKDEITKAVDTLSSAVEAEQQAFQAWEIHAKDYQKKLTEGQRAVNVCINGSYALAEMLDSTKMN